MLVINQPKRNQPELKHLMLNRQVASYLKMEGAASFKINFRYHLLYAPTLVWDQLYVYSMLF